MLITFYCVIDTSRADTFRGRSLCDEKIARATTLGLTIITYFVFTAFHWAFLHITRFLEQRLLPDAILLWKNFVAKISSKVAKNCKLSQTLCVCSISFILKGIMMF